MLLNSQKTIRVVRIWDPAIDMRDAESLTEYMRDLDIKKLKFLPEKKPMIFTIRPLTSDCVMDFIMAVETVSERQKRAFSAAVIQVDNFVSEDGEREEPTWTPSIVRDESGRERNITGMYELLTKQERSLFGVMSIVEIGEMALQRAFLPRGIEAPFVPPRLSLQILARRSFQFVEQAKNMAEGGKLASPPVQEAQKPEPA